MNQLNLIEALTGVIPGQSANGNDSQGALAGSGAGLFSDLVGQQLAASAKAPPGNQPGGTAAAGSPGNGSPVDELTGGNSALLPAMAGAAAGQSPLASPELNASAASGRGSISAARGQVLVDPGDRAAPPADQNAASAAEIPPPQAEVLNPVDDDSAILAVGTKNQDIAAALPEISPGDQTGETGDANIIIAPLPAEASTSAALSPGKAGAAAAIPASGAATHVQLAQAIAPASEAVVAATGALGPAASPAAPAARTAGDEVAAPGPNRILKAEGDNQPRLQTAAKGSAETLDNFTGSAGGSDDAGGQGERGNPHHGARNNGDGGANARPGSSAGTPTGKGIKTSVGAGQAGLNLVTELPGAGHSSPPLASQLTPLGALESAMTHNAGPALPFDGGAAVDPMTGMQTSQSAQSLAAGPQALQAGTSISAISGAAPGAASLAHAPNFIAHQVGLHITKAIADGQNEFTIRLNPPELGRVEVRLEFATDGSVKAALSAEKPETLNLLQRDASALERALNDAGVKTDSGSLNFSLQQGAAGSHQDGADNAGNAGTEAATSQQLAGDYPPDGETEISEQIIQQMVADGAVDIRV